MIQRLRERYDNWREVRRLKSEAHVIFVRYVKVFGYRAGDWPDVYVRRWGVAQDLAKIAHLKYLEKWR